ncbi:MAG: hypothetical protein IIW64_04785, partial [Selenomonadaceae bacterium]|nr:hypothetical protein [Selenomonadaceae bacterium]
LAFWFTGQGVIEMMHPFMELNDGTQIVHSDVMYDETGKEVVEVYVEKPINLGFKSAYCSLPAYKWDKVDGFDEEEMRQLEEIIQSTAHLIIQFARQGGLGNAANF